MRERNRLIAKLRQTVERLHSLEREVAKLERRADLTRGDGAGLRRELGMRRADLAEISDASEVGLTELKRALQRIQSRRGCLPTGKKGAHPGEPAPGCVHRQEIYPPWPAVPGFDPGGQYRPHEGRREIRVAPRLQVFDLCHLVDSPGDYTRHLRSGAHHTRASAHGRAHQQDDTRQPRDGAGTRPRAHVWKNWPSAWRSPSTRCVR